MFFSDSLLITYKGKVLLSTRDLAITHNIKNVWSFIGEGRLKGKSLKNSAEREITDATKLVIKDIDSVELFHKNTAKLLYHAKLTDDNVNSIVRRTGERLEFYDLNEIEKLSLSEATNMIFSENKQKLESLVAE